MRREFEGLLAQVSGWVEKSQAKNVNYHHFLKAFHSVLNPKTYVEVGVQRGHSIRHAGTNTRCVGIDPEPIIDSELSSSTRIYKTTSDEFFSQNDLRTELGGGVELAFLDGMHLFEYTLRDFMNVEKYSDANSIVLIHDCNPIDKVTSQRNRTTQVWTGDIWKLIVCLKKYRPDLDIATLDVAPSGLGVVGNLNSDSRVLSENYDRIVQEWMDLEFEYVSSDRSELLRLVHPGDLQASRTETS